ncbi:MAG: helix-turn-helix domain-containing protein [Pseudomonadota bacterium]
MKYIRTDTAAEYLGVSKATLEKDRVTGLIGIPYIKLGRAVLYDPDDLDTFMGRNKVGGCAYE